MTGPMIVQNIVPATPDTDAVLSFIDAIEDIENRRRAILAEYAESTLPVLLRLG